MSVLDLQSMKIERDPGKGPPPGSRASKGCGNTDGGDGNTSTLSVAICAF